MTFSSNRSHILFLVGSVSALGCGGSNTGVATDAATVSDSGTSSDGAASADAASGDGGATGDAGSRDGGAVSGDTGPVESSPHVEISDLYVYANCMPIVASDPIHAGWTATVTDAVGSVASIADATLTITGASTVNQTLNVEHSVIELSGGTGSAEQRKVTGLGSPGGACGDLCSDAEARVYLTFSVDGQLVTATAAAPFSCVR